MIENYNFDYVDEPMLSITKYAASTDCRSDKVLEIQKYKNIILDPLCVLSKNKILSDFENLNTSELEIENQTVIFLGTWYNVWGHLLTDTLSRFWFVNSIHYLENQLGDCKILYYAENSNFPSQFYELLEIIGIKRNRLQLIDKPLYCNELFVPDESIFVKEDSIVLNKDVDKKNGLYYYTREFHSLIEQIKESIINDNKFEKIFFTVPPSSKFLGLKQIEKTLKSQGFLIINPSVLSLKKQLSYICNCKVFATFEGSISFNALFLCSNTDLVLIRKLSYIDPYQFMINQISDAKTIYVDSHISLFCDKNYPYLGPFLLYPSENFKNYFNIKNTHNISILLLLKYFIRSIKMQKERTAFITDVKYEIDMYYFDILNLMLRKSLFNKFFIKMINKFIDKK